MPETFITNHFSSAIHWSDGNVFSLDVEGQWSATRDNRDHWQDTNLCFSHINQCLHSSVHLEHPPRCFEAVTQRCAVSDFHTKDALFFSRRLLSVAAVRKSEKTHDSFRPFPPTPLTIYRNKWTWMINKLCYTHLLIKNQKYRHFSRHSKLESPETPCVCSH